MWQSYYKLLVAALQYNSVYFALPHNLADKVMIPNIHTSYIKVEPCYASTCVSTHHL